MIGGSVPKTLSQKGKRSSRDGGLLGKRGEVGACQPVKCLGRDGKDMAWGAGGGPDLRKCHQARVHPDRDRRQMPHRGHAANGKARDIAHGAAIGTAQCLPRQSTGAGWVNLIAAGGQEQIKPPALALKQDRLHDLVQAAARRFRRLRRSAGFIRHFNGLCVHPSGAQGFNDTGKRFRHGVSSAVDLADPQAGRNPDEKAQAARGGLFDACGTHRR